MQCCGHVCIVLLLSVGYGVLWCDLYCVAVGQGVGVSFLPLSADISAAAANADAAAAADAAVAAGVCWLLVVGMRQVCGRLPCGTPTLVT
jgi:hypothetical protein